MKLISLLLIQIGFGLTEDITTKLDYSVNARRLEVFQDCLTACSNDPQNHKDNYLANECAHVCRDNHDVTLEEDLKQVGFKPDPSVIFAREEHALYRAVNTCHRACHTNKDPNARHTTLQCVLSCDRKLNDGLTKIKNELGLGPNPEEQFIKEDTDLANTNLECQSGCHYSVELKSIINGVRDCVIKCSQAHSIGRSNLLMKNKRSEAKPNMSYTQEQTIIFNKNHKCRSDCVANNLSDTTKQLSCAHECQRTIEYEEKELNKKYSQASSSTLDKTQFGNPIANDAATRNSAATNDSGDITNTTKNSGSAESGVEPTKKSDQTAKKSDQATSNSSNSAVKIIRNSILASMTTAFITSAL